MATDEVVPSYYNFNGSPRYILALRTEEAKLAVYADWRDGTAVIDPDTVELEFYDYATEGGRLELDNQPDHPQARRMLRELFSRYVPLEMEQPLPGALGDVSNLAKAQFIAFVTALDSLGEGAPHRSQPRTLHRVRRSVLRAELGVRRSPRRGTVGGCASSLPFTSLTSRSMAPSSHGAGSGSITVRDAFGWSTTTTCRRAARSDRAHRRTGMPRWRSAGVTAWSLEPRRRRSNHVWLEGLEPDTAYTYHVTVDGEPWVPEAGRVRTHPAEDAAVPVTFAALGDYGVGIVNGEAGRRQAARCAHTDVAGRPS